MPPTLLACGSNAASHLSIGHSDDVFRLTPTIYHPSLPPFPPSTEILDLVSASAHSLLLLGSPASSTDRNARQKNTLLGAGTNTFGQLGPRCALWDDVKPESRAKELNLLASADIKGINDEEWEPVKIAATWTTSIVVYQRVLALSTHNVQEDGSSGMSNKIGRDKEYGPDQIVISCGSNDFGELGSMSSVNQILDAPAQIPISTPSQKPTVVDLGLGQNEKVQFLKGGQRHVIAVIESNQSSEDGHRQRLVGWGASRKGELDPRSTLSSSFAEGKGSSTTSSGKGKGKGKAVSRPSISPPTIIERPLNPNEQITDIALGASHTLVLLSKGTVLAWGSNLKNQITGVHEVSNVRAISTSWNGSYLLTPSGLLSQGSNTHGQLIRRANTNSITSTSAERGLIDTPKGWEVKRIVAGTEHLLVLATKEGEERLFAGGWNEHGNLALGDQVDRSTLQEVEVKGRVKGLWAGCASTWIWVEE